MNENQRSGTPEMQYVWVIAAIMVDTEEDAKELLVGRIQQVYWWGYGLEIYLQSTQ